MAHLNSPEGFKICVCYLNNDGNAQPRRSADPLNTFCMCVEGIRATPWLCMLAWAELRKLTAHHWRSLISIAIKCSFLAFLSETSSERGFREGILHTKREGFETRTVWSPRRGVEHYLAASEMHVWSPRPGVEHYLAANISTMPWHLRMPRPLQC